MRKGTSDPQTRGSTFTQVHDRNLVKCAQPIAGIYYLVRYPSGWNVLTWAYEDGLPHWDHPEFWEYHVAPIMAAKWARRRRTTSDRLLQHLHLHTYAFPRGRITIYRGKTRVLHGSDTIAPMRFDTAAIEREFNLVQPLWEDDEHEHCHEDDKEAVRHLFGIKEDWPGI